MRNKRQSRLGLPLPSAEQRAADGRSDGRGAATRLGDTGSLPTRPHEGPRSLHRHWWCQVGTLAGGAAVQGVGMRHRGGRRQSVRKADSSQGPAAPSGLARSLKKAPKDGVITWKRSQSSFLLDSSHVQEVRSLS